MKLKLVFSFGILFLAVAFAVSGAENADQPQEPLNNNNATRISVQNDKTNNNTNNSTTTVSAQEKGLVQIIEEKVADFEDKLTNATVADSEPSKPTDSADKGKQEGGEGKDPSPQEDKGNFSEPSNSSSAGEPEKNATESGSTDSSSSEPQNPAESDDKTPSEILLEHFFASPANLSVDAYLEHKDLIQGGSVLLPRAALRNQLLMWAERNGIKEEYEAFMNDFDSTVNEYFKSHMTNLTGEEMCKYAQLKAIADNGNLTQVEECKSYNDLFLEMNEELQRSVPDPFYTSHYECMRPRYMITAPADCPPELVLQSELPKPRGGGCGGGAGGCGGGSGGCGGGGGGCGSGGGGCGGGCGSGGKKHKPKHVVEGEEHGCPHHGDGHCGDGCEGHQHPGGACPHHPDCNSCEEGGCNSCAGGEKGGCGGGCSH